MKRIIFTIIIILLAFNSFAADKPMSKIVMPTARTNGFGGHHTAYTDNVYSLFVNPAAMIRVNEISTFSFSPSFYSPGSAFSIISPLAKSFFGSSKNLGTALGKFSQKAIGFELREFPLSVAYVANGFGFAAMNSTNLNLALRGTYVTTSLYEDIALPFGFAFKIFEKDSHFIDAGIAVKPFTRFMGEAKVDLFNLMTDNASLFDGIHMPIIVGCAADIGFMYRWEPEGLQAGLTFDDIIGRGAPVASIGGKDKNSYYIPFNMNLGLAYTLRPERFWNDLPDAVKDLGVTATFDWRDFTNTFQQDDYTRRNNSLDFAVGLEFSWKKMIFLRFGMQEMLPGFGFGFDLGSAKIDFAYYGRELSTEPGNLSTAIIELAVSIRPKAKEKNWPWAKQPIMSYFGAGDSSEEQTVESVDVDEITETDIFSAYETEAEIIEEAEPESESSLDI